MLGELLMLIAPAEDELATDVIDAPLEDDVFAIDVPLKLFIADLIVLATTFNCSDLLFLLLPSETTTSISSSLSSLSSSDAFSSSSYVISYSFDLESLQNKRSEWGLFRDRREDLYTTVIN